MAISPFLEDFSGEDKIPPISADDKAFLTEKYRRHWQLATQASCPTLIGATLLVCSLILIFCGGLCLTLPGVNVISQVTYHAFIPGTCGLVASIPFLYMAVEPSYEKAAVRAEWIERVVTILDHNLRDLPGKPANRNLWGAEFIKDNILPEANKDYQNSFLKEIKTHYEKDQEEGQPPLEREEARHNKKMAQILDKAISCLRKDKPVKPPEARPEEVQL